MKKTILKHGNSAVKWWTHCRRVSTKSVLSNVFNTSTKPDTISSHKTTGLFGVDVLKTPEGFLEAKNAAIEQGWKILDKATSCKPGKETIVLFDELSNTLCKVADLSDFVRATHPDRAFAEAANEAHISIGTMVEELNTHADLHRALRRVVQDESLMKSFDEETRNVAELFLFDFEISGVHLESHKRAEAVKLHEEILHLTSQIMQNASRSVAVDKNLLPSSLQTVFPSIQNTDNVQISGLYSDNSNESIREAAYRIYLYQNPDQEAILNRLLLARFELASLVGYESFSERALKSTMAKTPENVKEFLTLLSAQLKPHAKKDYNEMLSLKKLDTQSAKSIFPWDVPYYFEKLKHKQCGFNITNYNAFFSLGHCMEGLNIICKNLYGISFQPVTPSEGEVWSNDVVKLEVRSPSEVIGYIYCDFYQRPGKPQQDCHFTIRGGRLNRDGTYQTPIVVLLLHLLPPTSTTPTLLSPSSVNNLFHEMGHALHSMVARTQYQHVTGTRCATDFAEVPSILMEYFSSDQRILSMFAQHYQTGEPLSPDMLIDINKAELVGAACEMQTQVFYSLVDQEFHSKHPLPNSLQKIFSQLNNEHSVVKHVPNTAWYLRFSHLVSYGAKYYAYLMSRAVAARLWNQCFKDDPLNHQTGQNYKNKMLSHGGGKNPILMYEDMLQEEFNMKNLVETLVDEIKT